MTRACTWLRSLLAAAAIHLTVGAALYWLLHTNPPPPPPAKVEPPSALIPYDIDLQNTAAANADPVAEPAGPVAKLGAPTVKQTPAPTTQTPLTTTASPVAPPVIAGTEGPAVPEGPPAGPPGQPSDQPGPAGSPSPPKLTGAGGGSHTAGPVGVVGPGPDRNRLIAQALARIRAERHYPELARRRGIEGTVHIAFVVGTDGHPRNITTQAADPLLEEAAREAVLRAAPLPPLGPAELDLDFHLDD